MHEEQLTIDTGINGSESGTATILMVRYRQPELEQKAIESVRRHTNLKRHRLVVIDNGRMDMNLGALWNRMIQKSATEFVCLLNTDTQVTEGWLDRMIGGAQQTGADAVGPRTNRCGNRPQVGKAELSWSCRAVKMLSGFCLLIRRETWEKHIGFREDLGLYGQDSNLMDRFDKKVIHTGVFVYHEGGASFPKDRDWTKEKLQDIEVYRRNQRFDWKHRLVVLGSGPDNPFPIWRGIDQALVEFRREGMFAEHQSFNGDPKDVADSIRKADPTVVIVACTNPTRLKRFLQHVRSTVGKNVPIGLWYNDLRPVPVGPGFVRGTIDRLFMCWSGSTKGADLEGWSRTFGAPVEYMPQGSVLQPMIAPSPPDDPRTVFVGGIYPNSPLYGNYRERITKQLGVEVYNSFHRLKRIEIEQSSRELYRRYQFCLSTSPQAPGYQSNRLYNILAYGGLALVDEFPGLDRLFRHGEHILKFPTQNINHAQAVIREYARQNKKNESIRRAGHRQQQLKHNVGFRLLNMVNNLTTDQRDFWGWL